MISWAKKAGIRICLVTAALIVFMSIPKSVLTEWLGIAELQERAAAVHNAAFWKIRAMTFPSEGEKYDEPQYGQIKGLSESGEVVVNVSKGGRWVTMAKPLAGIKIQDRYRAAIHLKALADTTAKIDVYRGPGGSNSESLVIWIHGKPVNLMLIEEGIAKPEPEPQTTIMDVAYATYYWRIAKGNEGGGE